MNVHSRFCNNVLKNYSSTSKQPDYSPLSVKRVNKLFDVHTVQLFFCEAVCLGNEDARTVCLAC